MLQSQFAESRAYDPSRRWSWVDLLTRFRLPLPPILNRVHNTLDGPCRFHFDRIDIDPWHRRNVECRVRQAHVSRSADELVMYLSKRTSGWNEVFNDLTDQTAGRDKWISVPS